MVYNQLLCWLLSIIPFMHDIQEDAKNKDNLIEMFIIIQSQEFFITIQNNINSVRTLHYNTKLSCQSSWTSITVQVYCNLTENWNCAPSTSFYTWVTYSTPTYKSQNHFHIAHILTFAKFLQYVQPHTITMLWA